MQASEKVIRNLPRALYLSLSLTSFSNKHRMRVYVVDIIGKKNRASRGNCYYFTNEQIILILVLLFLSMQLFDKFVITNTVCLRLQLRQSFGALRSRQEI